MYKIPYSKLETTFSESSEFLIESRMKVFDTEISYPSFEECALEIFNKKDYARHFNIYDDGWNEERTTKEMERVFTTVSSELHRKSSRSGCDTIVANLETIKKYSQVEYISKRVAFHQVEKMPNNTALFCICGMQGARPIVELEEKWIIVDPLIDEAVMVVKIDFYNYEY